MSCKVHYKAFKRTRSFLIGVANNLASIWVTGAVSRSKTSGGEGTQNQVHFEVIEHLHSWFVWLADTL